LRLDLIVPGTGRLHEPVPVTIRLTNTSTQPIEVYFVGREITFDIVVRGENGATVWRRLEGKTVQTVLQVRRFQPNETLELTDSWTPTTTGRFTVEGVVVGDAESLTTNPTQVLIVSR